MPSGHKGKESLRRKAGELFKSMVKAKSPQNMTESQKSCGISVRDICWSDIVQMLFQRSHDGPHDETYPLNFLEEKCPLIQCFNIHLPIKMYSIRKEAGKHIAPHFGELWIPAGLCSSVVPVLGALLPLACD